MKKRIIASLVCAMLATSLIACGGSSETSNSSSGYKAAADSGSYEAAEYYADDYDYNYDVAEEAYISDGSGSSTAVDTTTTENATTSNRKLIRTVNLSVETKEFDKLVDNISSEVTSRGGYVENMNGYYGSTYRSDVSSKSATIVARIPAAQLDSFLELVGERSNITNKSESVEDITLSYVDMESHKKMLEEEQSRLLSFLSEATSIDEIITIEERLTTVKYQIESMEAQLRTYDNKIDYSTVTINITEVVDYTEIVEPEPEKTTWERISDGFVKNLLNIINWLKEFGIWILVNIPYLLIWALVIIVCIILYKKVFKKMLADSKKKNEEIRTMNIQRMNQMRAMQGNMGMPMPNGNGMMPNIVPSQELTPAKIEVPDTVSSGDVIEKIDGSATEEKKADSESVGEKVE